MCIRDSFTTIRKSIKKLQTIEKMLSDGSAENLTKKERLVTVSYTHLRAHETVLDLVCRLLLEKKKQTQTQIQ